MQIVKNLFNYLNIVKKPPRIGRVHFFVLSVIYSMILSLIQKLFGWKFLEMPNNEILWGGFLVAITILGVVIQIILSIKRLHDFNARGWWVLVQFSVIPILSIIVFFPSSALPLGGAVLVAGLIFLCLLLFMPGTKGKNRFGAQPPPPSIAEKRTAIILAVFFIVSLLILVTLMLIKIFS